MKRLLVALAAAFCLVSAPAMATGDGAKDFIDGLASQVLAIVKSDGEKDVKTKKIEAIFTDKVDMDFIARFVVGKSWRSATPAQQQAYIAAYKPFILKNYASRLTKYSGQTYTLKKTRSDNDSTMVTMEIADPSGSAFMVDYRLKSNGGGYKIQDIVVEGVSLLTTQRQEFSGIIDQKGIEGLTEALKNQVASKN